jgi:hypothetical protein
MSIFGPLIADPELNHGIVSRCGTGGSGDPSQDARGRTGCRAPQADGAFASQRGGDERGP